MKRLVFYSNDYNIGYSFLMYLQNIYNVTITTDLNILKNVVNSSDVDIIILDSEPTDEIELFLESVKEDFPGVHVILTYVYKEQLKDLDFRIRKVSNSIFYKPYDLNEVTRQLAAFVA